MIESVFELGDTIAREIMIPRPDVETVAASASLSELRSVAAEGAYTRYPVLDEDGEHPRVRPRQGRSPGQRGRRRLLGRVPAVGDRIEREGYVLRVVAVTDSRIDRLVIRPIEGSETDPGEAAERDEADGEPF